MTPWEATNTPSGIRVSPTGDLHNWYVLTRNGLPVVRGLCEADARAIAAMPELLHACEDARAVLAFYENGPVTNLVERAIAKAMGVQ